jgi:hypothetical protein
MPNFCEPIEDIEGDTEEWKSFESARIVDKRCAKYGHRLSLEYLA